MAIGDYTKTTYINGMPPALNSARLNNNEDKTKELDTAVEEINTWQNNMSSTPTANAIVQWGSAPSGTITLAIKGSTTDPTNIVYYQNTLRYNVLGNIFVGHLQLDCFWDSLGTGTMYILADLPGATNGYLTPIVQIGYVSKGDMAVYYNSITKRLYLQYANLYSSPDSYAWSDHTEGEISIDCMIMYYIS